MFSATWNIYTVYILIDLDWLNLYNNIKQTTAKDFKTSVKWLNVRFRSLQSWSSRCRSWLWWRQWASWGSCSWAQSQSWQCREPPRHHQCSGSSKVHQSRPDSCDRKHMISVQIPHDSTQAITSCPLKTLSVLRVNLQTFLWNTEFYIKQYDVSCLLF